jgi:tellurite resistance protein TerC
MPPAVVFRSLLVFDEKHPFYGSYKIAKRIAIGIVGGTILLLGFVMMVTPGPGIPAILVGLGILGVEFAWARHWLKKVKAKASDMTRAITGRNKTDPPPPADPSGPPAAP